jgi:hypothetical protein
VERDVTTGNFAKAAAIIAKLAATIVVIPVAHMALKALLYRYHSLTFSQQISAYLLVLLPFWIVLWRRGVAPEPRVIGFAAGLGIGVLLFLAGNQVKWLVIARAPDPQFRLTPFIGYLALTFASWIVAGSIAYWIATPTTARHNDC